MLESLADKSIQTKIKAMYGHRLNKSDFDEMLHKRNVGEIAGYLKSDTYYKETLSNVQETMIHRGQLENMLGHHLFSDVKRLKKYTKTRSGLFDVFFMNIEIQQIVSCIGYMQSGQQGDFLLNVPGYLLGQLTIDLSRMVYAKNSSELATALEKTRYHKTILKLIEENDGNLPEASVCAVSLKKLYYEIIFSIIDKNYSGQERENLKGMILFQIETTNIATAFRLKKYFNADDGEIGRYVIPYYSAIHKKAFEEILKSNTEKDFIRNLTKNRIFKHLDAQDFDFIEYSMMMLRAKRNKRLLNFTTSPAVSCLAYIYLRQLELQNIINIIEGVRYKITPEDMQKLLIIA